MDATLKMQEQLAKKRNLPLQLVALFIFLLVGGFFCILVLAEDGGETSKNYKVAVVLSVFCRLAWQTYKHTFQFKDYFIYFAIVIGFCFLADYELGHILSTR